MPVKIFTKIFPGWTGGNYIDIQSSVAPPAYLLDFYPGATLGYSVRKLRDAYTGFAFEVRRDSDNATTNIGFVGEDLDVAALTTFLGSGGVKGYITKWYNQAASPVANSDLVQTTALLQPLIGVSGGQYYIFWESVRATKMNTTAAASLEVINPTGVFSTFAMAIPTVTTVDGILFQQDQFVTRIGQFTRFNGDATSMSVAFGTTGVFATDVGPAYTANTSYVHSVLRPTTSLEVFLNGASNGTTSVSGGRYNASNMGNAYAGSRLTSESFDGYNGELILYPSVMTADRVGIENNIRTYYGF
jgi:hypothetical protein